MQTIEKKLEIEAIEKENFDDEEGNKEGEGEGEGLGGEGVPKRRQNTPMMALCSTTLRSASRASSSPPATA